MSLVFAVVAYRLLLSGSRVFAACSPPADERLGARRQRAVASRGPPPKQKTGLPAQACSDGSACPRPVTDHGLGDDRPQFDARPATKQITAPAAEPPANRQIRSQHGTAGSGPHLRGSPTLGRAEPPYGRSRPCPVSRTSRRSISAWMS